MQNVSFSFEGDGIPVLRAELFNIGGDAIGADINISERIGNDNGQFVFGKRCPCDVVSEEANGL